MCLCVIDKKFKPNDKVRAGYKGFSRTSDGTLRSLFDRGKDIVIGEWMKADSEPIEMLDPPPPKAKIGPKIWSRDNPPIYRSGFHVFEKLSDARKYGATEIRLVFVRNTRLIGREYYYSTAMPPSGPIYVADEMFVTNKIYSGETK